ncbi:hypothetical protein N9N28_01115 [Rubripirellula amarantea]|uniref:Uncharacterized protein n=1 Tax=Rubripirellula amarantea TaxID=2527999 RepID=A0A5C5WFN6_9BACT|nr:hypothetical protein [Rubripirellula amarantea]MDA8743205.1 hypothetical protein [Rubripirellula amarantea]TWT49470.1 hypothetical protein Pla22_46670 [Rubripirellula amarantea]
MNDKTDSFVLRDDRIIATVATLRRRIEERFPGSGLSGLCQRLLDVSQHAAERANQISQPIKSIRILGFAMATLLIVVLVASVIYALLKVEADKIGVLEWIAAIESGLNDIIFFAIAIYFLVRLETRIKRERTLKAIHELRAIAHIIDMHQLTKNPERYVREWTDTKNSPKKTMSAFELNRYLDYCSEMLSLIGKIAALYVQHFDDADAVAAVSEVEQLTTGLSRKIWQKIMILEQTRVLDDCNDTQPDQPDSPCPTTPT